MPASYIEDIEKEIKSMRRENEKFEQKLETSEGKVTFASTNAITQPIVITLTTAITQTIVSTTTVTTTTVTTQTTAIAQTTVDHPPQPTTAPIKPREAS